jgi:Tfp pilus assembly protein PilX
LTRTATRRGVAVVGFVAALLVIGTMVLWLFHATTSTNMSALGHFYSTGAMYAAESGLEMAMVELNGNQTTGTSPNNIDSDAAIGAISDNGNDADDPQVSTGALYVQNVSSSPPTYRAIGRPIQGTAPWNTFKRTLEIRTQ